MEMGELKTEFKDVKQEMRSIFETLFNFLQKRVQLIKALCGPRVFGSMRFPLDGELEFLFEKLIFI